MSDTHKRQGMIFVLVGPAGAGKNALMNVVLESLPDLRQFATATTRPMRSTEAQGREHLFMNMVEFQRLIDANALLEWQEVHGNRYGMPRHPIESAIAEVHDLIADIDVLGATYLRSIYPDNTVLIFIRPSSLDELKERMKTRGDSEAEIATRLRRVDMEMEYAPLCDYLITNDAREQASDMLRAIILAERSRRDLLNLRVEHNLPRHRLTYSTRVIPLYGTQVLRRLSAPWFPTDALLHGEYPHDAALRLLHDLLATEVKVENLYAETWNGPLILPVGLSTSTHDHFQRLEFVYLYLLPEHVTPPNGWEWAAYRQVELPDAVTEAIEALQHQLTSHD